MAVVCTLILGVSVVDRGTLLLAANRDEEPARPSDPPMVLADRRAITAARGARPERVVGGRDRLAGGTWLAVVDRDRVVAMLNRRPLPDAGQGPPTRSRGLLALDQAQVLLDPIEAMDLAVGADRYAPFTMVRGAAGHALVFTHDGGHDAPRVTTLTEGWHVLTHAELDDPQEPRTAWLMDALDGFAPANLADAERGLTALLATHEGAGPAVCLHEGRMVTVSSARVWLAPGEASYHHAEGPPCTTPFVDYSHALAGRVSRGVTEAR